MYRCNDDESLFLSITINSRLCIRLDASLPRVSIYLYTTYLLVDQSQEYTRCNDDPSPFAQTMSDFTLDGDVLKGTL